MTELDATVEQFKAIVLKRSILVGSRTKVFEVEENRRFNRQKKIDDLWKSHKELINGNRQNW